MEQSTKPLENPSPSPENFPAAVPPPTLPASTFTKVDKNLTGIGFFTASSKRSRQAIEKTTVIIDEGKEHRISIIPSAKYGLPITFDQDCWLALMHLVEDRRRQLGAITNPFTFTTAELTKILGLAHSGKNYKAVQEWLSVMKHTGVEGGAYNVAKKKWFTDKVSAVNRVLNIGEELPDGTIADKNHIWFSDWQLDNINAGGLIPIELNVYTQLENNISKNLVPHLQEWLFASQGDGKFEKQYEDICQLLGVRTYRYRSQIEEQFGPSLNELVRYGYLLKWGIEPMATRKTYKLVLWHGPKYHSDRQARIEKKFRIEGGDEQARRPRQRRLHLEPPIEPQPPLIIDYRVIAELAKRGIGETDARELMAKLSPGQPILDQLEWGDYQIAQAKGKITNPPGFYISLLQRNVPVPATFETSQQRKASQNAESAQRQVFLREQEARLAAEEAETAALEQQIDSLPETSRLALLSQAKADLLATHPKPDFLAHQFKTHPEADSMIRARARKMLKDGWSPSSQPGVAPVPSLASSQPADLQPLASQPQPAPAKTELQSLVEILKTILATPQLPAPVQQPIVELQERRKTDDHLV